MGQAVGNSPMDGNRYQLPPMPEPTNPAPPPPDSFAPLPPNYVAPAPPSTGETAAKVNQQLLVTVSSAGEVFVPVRERADAAPPLFNAKRGGVIFEGPFKPTVDKVDDTFKAVAEPPPSKSKGCGGFIARLLPSGSKKEKPPISPNVVKATSSIKPSAVSGEQTRLRNQAVRDLQFQVLEKMNSHVDDWINLGEDRVNVPDQFSIKLDTKFGRLQAGEEKSEMVKELCKPDKYPNQQAVDDVVSGGVDKLLDKANADQIFAIAKQLSTQSNAEYFPRESAKNIFEGFREYAQAKIEKQPNAADLIEANKEHKMGVLAEELRHLSIEDRKRLGTILHMMTKISDGNGLEKNDNQRLALAMMFMPILMEGVKNAKDITGTEGGNGVKLAKEGLTGAMEFMAQNWDAINQRV